MTTKTLLIIGGIAVAAYLVYSQIKKNATTAAASSAANTISTGATFLQSLFGGSNSVSHVNPPATSPANQNPTQVNTNGPSTPTTTDNNYGGDNDTGLDDSASDDNQD